MTTVSWRTITSRRKEWMVPAAQPWGACLGDMRDGIAMASVQYRRDHDLADDAVLADDALRFHVTDDEIVISYVIEADERAQTAAEAAWRHLAVRQEPSSPQEAQNGP